MYYELYIDLFFCINALLDAFVLLLVKRMQRYTCSVLRLLLGAMAGSAILCIYVCMPYTHIWIIRTLFYFISFACMEGIAFSKNCITEHIRGIITLYVSSLILNGICSWLQIRSRHIWDLCLTGIGIYVAWEIVYTVYKNLKRKTDTICKVKMIYKGHCIQVKGLWDTGNCLHMIGSGRGVSVIGLDVMRAYLSAEFCRKMDAGEYENVQACAQDGIKCIAYETIGSRRKWMPVMEAEYMYIEMPDGMREYQRPLIGISRYPVSSRNAFEMVLTTNG